MANLLFLLCLLFSSVTVVLYAFDANITVAMDGSGDFETIGAALDSAPINTAFPFVILVKKGVYHENIYLPPAKPNVVILGEGINNKIITSNRSVERGFDTQQTATMDISASQFVAMDITIINSAGPKGGQAVALRTYGYEIAFHRCSMQGYQDTIFAAYGQQFFLDCQIYGTVDFIFGNAAIVVQNSFIYLRKPLQGQPNVITAQGREYEKNNTGIVIHNCTITAAPELLPNKSTVKNYLGRPWKKFSRTIIIQSFLDDLIDLAGWLEWDGSTFALSTLYYAEYGNFGPGARTWQSQMAWIPSPY